MTARVTRAILSHDAVTDAMLRTRFRDGSLTMAGSRVFFADATAAEAAGYPPLRALLPGRIRCLEIGAGFRHIGDVVP